jgi:hypothetical protein
VDSGAKPTLSRSRATSQVDTVGRGRRSTLQPASFVRPQDSPGALPPAAPKTLIPVNKRAGVAIDPWAVIAGVAIDPRAVIASVTVAVDSRPINAGATIAVDSRPINAGVTVAVGSRPINAAVPQVYLRDTSLGGLGH